MGRGAALLPTGVLLPGYGGERTPECNAGAAGDGLLRAGAGQQGDDGATVEAVGQGV